MSNNPVVHIIGGGLAGCEAAFQSARLGVPIVLHEMRPVRGTEAHLTDGLAELVCSNSFRSDDYEYNAVGLLHEEMRRCGSLILACGDANKVPAGGALAVDRGAFSDAVTAAIEAEPLITVERSEIDGLPPEDWQNVIVATGPLTSPAISQAILDVTGEESSPFSMRSPLSCIKKASTCHRPGFSPVTTRATVRTISTARWTARSTSILSKL